jgi:glycosyltransferase involved in cell wall biosynthesis
MKNKITCVVSCPCDTYSGYGRRALDFVKQLIKVKPDWDIKILSQRWGDTRMGYLQDNEGWEIISRIVPNIMNKPDVWIQITVPNEFQAVGRYNIGMTAAIETNLCDVEWIKGCNRMDLVIASSEHGRNSLVGTKYTNNATGEELMVRVPVEVLFEGIDLSLFNKIENSKKSPVLADLKNAWNYLLVGHWLQGDYGEDRKNIAYTIRMFLEAFKDQKQAPGLIVKTSHATTSYMDQEDIINRIHNICSMVQYKESLPNIYLLHGDLTDEELNGVYNDPRVKAMVSFTKGEGYGRPLAEFAMVGKPILVSGWSGHRDFLDEKHTAMVGGTLEKVHPSAVQPHMILAEASWFKPNDDQVIAGYREVYNNYENWLKKAEKQAKSLRVLKDMDAMGEEIEDLFGKYIPEFPTEVELNLPKELLADEEAK